MKLFSFSPVQKELSQCLTEGDWNGWCLKIFWDACVCMGGTGRVLPWQDSDLPHMPPSPRACIPALQCLPIIGTLEAGLYFSLALLLSSQMTGSPTWEEGHEGWGVFKGKQELVDPAFLLEVLSEHHRRWYLYVCFLVSCLSFCLYFLSNSFFLEYFE